MPDVTHTSQGDFKVKVKLGVEQFQEDATSAHHAASHFSAETASRLFKCPDVSSYLSGTQQKLAPLQSMFSELLKRDLLLCVVVGLVGLLCSGLVLAAVTAISSLAIVCCIFGVSGTLFVAGILCTPFLLGICLVGVPIVIVCCLLGLGACATLGLVWAGRYLWIARPRAASMTEEEASKLESSVARARMAQQGQ